MPFALVLTDLLFSNHWNKTLELLLNYLIQLHSMNQPTTPDSSRYLYLVPWSKSCSARVLPVFLVFLFHLRLFGWLSLV